MEPLSRPQAIIDFCLAPLELDTRLGGRTGGPPPSGARHQDVPGQGRYRRCADQRRFLARCPAGDQRSRPRLRIDRQTWPYRAANRVRSSLPSSASRLSSSAASNGLARCRSAPAAWPAAICSGRALAVSMTIGCAAWTHGRLVQADFAHRGQAVHDGHLHVHQHQVEGLRAASVHRLCAVLDRDQIDRRPGPGSARRPCGWSDGRRQSARATPLRQRIGRA